MASTNLIRRVLMHLDKTYLPYENFDKFEFFKKHEIIKGVTIERLPSKIGSFFKTSIKKDTTIIEHYHNSLEYFYVQKGKVLINDTIELKEGDEFEFKPFELHKIEAHEDTLMYVQFIKNGKQ